MPVLANLLAEHSIQDIRDYAKLRVIVAYAPYLGTKFDEPLLVLSQALTGASVLPEKQERALELIKAKLGQPVSKLYTDNFFPAATRQKAAEMVGLIKGAFLERMPQRAWLSDQTRAAALEKLEKLSFKIGYPDQWIDYSQVEVTDNLVETVAAIARFQRRAGSPKVRPAGGVSRLFQHARKSANGDQCRLQSDHQRLRSACSDYPGAHVRFENSSNSEPASTSAAWAAVLGHEMTHGFDWMGKQFDKVGNLKNWWQPADGEAFDALAAKADRPSQSAMWSCQVL